jgi:hypothetical protein
VRQAGFTPSTYTLSQDLLLPTGLSSANLSWSDTSVSGYSGTPRTLSVDFYDGATLLGNVFTYVVPSSDGLAGWDARSFDVSALLAPYGGSTVQLRFSNSIPESWTGPAGLGLDVVSLQVEAAAPVPEPGSIMLLASGLAALRVRRRRKT